MLLLLLAGYGWICHKNFKLGLGIFIFLLPSYFIRFQFGPLPTTLLELSLAVLALFWLFREKGWQNIDKNIKIWLGPIILFFSAAIVGALVSPDKISGLGILKAYFIEPIFFFFIIVTTLKTRQDWLFALRWLCLSGLVVAGYAIIQKLTGLGIPKPWDTEGRATSFFGFPNAVGLYLGPVIIASFGLLYENIKKQAWLMSAFFGLSFALSFLAIIFSQTEAAWIAVGCGLLIFCFFKKDLWMPAAVIIVIAVLILGLTPGLRQNAAEKITLQDWSGQVRQTIWQESFNMLKTRPILGAGLAGYPLAIIPFHRAGYIEIFQYPHNFVLNFWSEIGILGLIAWLWLIATALKISLKNYQENLSLIIIACLAATLIHGLVDVPYFKNDLSMAFWLFMAMAFYIKKSGKLPE